MASKSGKFEQAFVKCLEGKQANKQVFLTFNPETVTFSKAVKWTKTEKPTSDNPDMDFGGGKSGTFSISEVVFDGTLPDVLKGVGKKGGSVRGQITKDIELLIKFAEIDDSIKPEPRPPKCQFVWGQYKSFKVYVESVKVAYELFEPSGKPLRAKVTIDFVEAEDANKLPYQNPTSRSYARKVHTVVAGETLDWIAYREYGDPAAWRHIAEANNIDDPFGLRPGQVLRLTPLGG